MRRPSRALLLLAAAPSINTTRAAALSALPPSPLPPSLAHLDSPRPPYLALLPQPAARLPLTLGQSCRSCKPLDNVSPPIRAVTRPHSPLRCFVVANAAERPSRAAPRHGAGSASDWQILLSLCTRDLPLLLAAFVALCFAAAGDALLPQLQSEALNVLLYTEPSSVSTTLRTPLIKLLSVGVLTALFTGIRGFLFWLSGGRLVKRLRAALFSSLLTKPQTFYDTRGTGELSSRLSADCIKLSDVLSLNVNIVLRQVL